MDIDDAETMAAGMVEMLLLLIMIHTFSELSLQLKKLRRHKSVIDLLNANPARGHKEVPRSMGHIMMTARYPNQQGSKSRQNPCQVQPTENIGNLSASRSYIWYELQFILSERSAFPSENLPVRAFDSRAQGFSTTLARRRSSCPAPCRTWCVPTQ